MQEKKAFINKMFSEITPVYDRMNRVISLGFDNSWRRRAVKPLSSAGRVLDLCAGSGDMSLSLLRRKEFKGKIVLCDFNREMLRLAESKLRKRGQEKLSERVMLVVADAEILPFREGSFDGITIGFSLRNLSSLESLAAEMLHAMRSGGLATLLEAAHPENRIVAPLFYFYFYELLPAVSRCLTAKGYAYRYLPASLRAFLSQRELVELFREAGFSSVSYSNVWGGVGAIYLLRK